MIVRLRGELSEVTDTTVILEREGRGLRGARAGVRAGRTGGPFAARPSCCIRWSTTKAARRGGNLIPRIVGFLHADDRAFFECFITVKGIGVRKGLKALTEPTGRIASHIESADAVALSRLPGVGKRTAEQIIVELRGKVTAFAQSGGVRGAGSNESSRMSQPQRDALELLVMWGDARSDAMRWLTRVAELQSDLKEVEAWVKAAYRIKAGHAETP